MLTKFWTFVKQFQFEIYLGSCFALVAIISYNLGHSAIFSRGDIVYSQNADIARAVDFATDRAMTPSVNKLDKRVVASKNSTSKLYHFTWCSGAKRIKEENKVWFASEAEAVTAGYSLAANCQ